MTTNGSNTPAGIVVQGTDASEWLWGSEAADTMYGKGGNDYLVAGAGADLLSGGTGNDTYYVDNSGDVVVENAGEGSDTVRTTLTSYTLGGNVENLILSTASSTGIGNSLANSMVGSSGNDVIDGGKGADTMVGGAGNDTYGVDNAGDVVVEDPNAGIDTVRVSLNAYTLGANLENLVLLAAKGATGTGNGLANRIDGGWGNDLLDGGAGNDTMAGGWGNDTYVVDSALDVIVENPGEGTDTVRTGLGSYTLGANLENLVLTSNTGATGTGNELANKIQGGAGNDSLDGRDGNDSLNGGAGTDLLQGGAGNDSLDGGAGFDRMTGGLGNDTYWVDSGDVVDEKANEGIDTVRTAMTFYQLGANIENLVLTSAGRAVGIGNELNNSILGGTGNNSLDGGKGNDTLDGGAGADTLRGGDGKDSFTVNDLGDVVVDAAAGETIVVAVAGMSSTQIAAWKAAGIDVRYRLTGTAAGESLSGGDSHDTLDGGAGADTMAGGLGNDTYIVDDRLDRVIEAENGAYDTVRVKADRYQLDANVEAAVILRTGGSLVTGNTLNNRITGGAGADTIDGGAGADTMIGGAGADVFYIDNTGDRVTDAQAGDTIVVRNTAYGRDRIDAWIAAGVNVGYELKDGTRQIVLNGLAGNDAFTVSGSGSTLLGGGGDDSLYTLGDRLTGGYRVDGGEGNDLIMALGWRSTLLGGSGNDTIRHLGSGSLIDAGDGDDVIDVSSDSRDDAVTVMGGRGNDSITTSVVIGQRYACVVDAGEGDDTITGGGKADTVSGGSGNDLFYVENAGTKILDAQRGDTIIINVQGYSNSTIDEWLANGVRVSVYDFAWPGMTWFGANGNDTIYANDRSTVIGLGGNDELHCDFLPGMLDGGGGDDTLIGQGIGADTLLGGSGHDLLWVSGSNGEVMTGGDGNDTFRFAPRNDGTSTSNTITDFTAGVDKIDLRLYGVLDPWLTFDSGKSVLNADFNKDGKTDLSLTLTGVTSFDIGQNVLLK